MKTRAGKRICERRFLQIQGGRTCDLLPSELDYQGTPMALPPPAANDSQQKVWRPLSKVNCKHKVHGD